MVGIYNPWCTVYVSDITCEDSSFAGFCMNGDDTIYAAIKPKSKEFEYYHSSLEPFDFMGGCALYKMSDFLLLGGKEHHDIAVYKYGDLYGYVETNSGKIIIPEQFSYVQPFSDGKYAKVRYPDGRSEFIDTAGQPFLPEGCEDSTDA